MQDVYPSRQQPHPALLSRQDPVTYREWGAEAPISREETERYARDGFLVRKAVFTHQEIAALQTEADRLRTSPQTLDQKTIITERGGDEVRSIFKAHAQSPVMNDLARDSRLAGVARFLLGDHIYVHQSRLNYKPGFRGKEFYWHSDFETWHVEDGMPRMRALSMSILLAPNTAENGPLMLIPGSHRSFVACVGETPEDHYRTSLKKQEYGTPDEESLTHLAQEEGLTAAIGEPGDVVIFDCNTMHGSNGNITPFARSNVFIVYNAVSNALVTPFGGRAPRPDFIAERDAKPLEIHAINA